MVPRIKGSFSFTVSEVVGVSGTERREGFKER